MTLPSRSFLRRVLPPLLLGALASGALAACGSDDGSGDDDTVELSFAYFSGVSDPHGRLWSWWMEEVTERSGGKVEFEPYWDGTLLGATDMVEGLSDGRADIATVPPTYYADRFPLTNVAELPFVSENVPAGSQAFAELYRSESDLQKEWDDVGLRPVAFNAGPGSAIGSVDPIDGVDDFDGLRLRALDRGSQVFKSAGANLINIALADLYASLDRGVVDGYYGVPFSFVGPTKLVEVTNHLVDPKVGLAAMSALAMSSERWDDLPSDVRDVMEEVAAEVPGKQAEFLAAAEDETCDAVRSADVKISVLPAAETAKLEKSAGAVRAGWIDEADAKGYDAQGFLDAYVTSVREAEDDFPDYETGVARCMAGSD